VLLLENRLKLCMLQLLHRGSNVRKTLPLLYTVVECLKGSWKDYKPVWGLKSFSREWGQMATSRDFLLETKDFGA
jgi:hypothetical protein